MTRFKGYFGIGLICFFYWVLDSVWSKLSFEYNLKKMIFSEQGSYLDTFLLRVSPYQMVSRLMVVCLFVILGSIVIEFMIKRRAAKKALMENEEKYRLIVENQNNLVVKYDSAQRIVYASPSYCRAFGKFENEIVGSDFKPLIHSEDISFGQASLTTLTEEPHVAFHEERVKTVEGWKWVSWSAKAVMNRNGEIKEIISVGRDITERKLAEKVLKEKTDFLDKVIESAALSTWISDEKGTVVRANPACLEFFGATEDEIVGKYNLFQDVVIEENGFMPDIREVFEKGKTANIIIDYDFGAVEHVSVKNATHKTVNSIFTPIKDADGKVSNVIVQTIDLTDIKRMEEQLTQSRKMESIGNLAGGIAHEFNNILSIIIGNNELVMEELPEWSLARESTEEIRIAGMRARDVVKQLLTFSRKDNSVKKVINIKSVVHESMKLIRSSTPSNIEIQQTLRDDVCPVLGNATQINQLLINICNNAVDAMPSMGGILAVDLFNEVVDEKHAKLHPKLKSGPYVKMVIRDNGSGMEKEKLDKIFEPYYTTKEIGKGTGIGLAVVHGIIERHEGLILADSLPGQGTTFTIYLPAHDDLPGPEFDEKILLPTGEESILYVDDEPSIAKLGRRHLENLGYTVEATTDPLKALGMVKKDPDKFDLVISDMAMPHMTGDQLIVEILKVRPDMPTIICTGYSARISETEAAKIGIRSFVMKPLNKAELAQTVRKVIDETKIFTH